jgi:hypothetical protein
VVRNKGEDKWIKYWILTSRIDRLQYAIELRTRIRTGISPGPPELLKALGRTSKIQRRLGRTLPWPTVDIPLILSLLG